MHHQILLMCAPIGRPILNLLCWITHSSMCNLQFKSRVVMNRRSVCTACTGQIRPIVHTVLRAWHTHHRPHIMISKSFICIGCISCWLDHYDVLTGSLFSHLWHNKKVKMKKTVVKVQRRCEEITSESIKIILHNNWTTPPSYLVICDQEVMSRYHFDWVESYNWFQEW